MWGLKKATERLDKHPTIKNPHKGELQPNDWDNERKEREPKRDGFQAGKVEKRKEEMLLSI